MLGYSIFIDHGETPEFLMLGMSLVGMRWFVLLEPAEMESPPVPAPPPKAKWSRVVKPPLPLEPGPPVIDRNTDLRIAAKQDDPWTPQVEKDMKKLRKAGYVV